MFGACIRRIVIWVVRAQQKFPGQPILASKADFKSACMWCHLNAATAVQTCTQLSKFNLHLLALRPTLGEAPGPYGAPSLRQFATWKKQYCKMTSGILRRSSPQTSTYFPPKKSGQQHPLWGRKSTDHWHFNGSPWHSWHLHWWHLCHHYQHSGLRQCGTWPGRRPQWNRCHHLQDPPQQTNSPWMHGCTGQTNCKGRAQQTHDDPRVDFLTFATSMSPTPRTSLLPGHSMSRTLSIKGLPQ